MKKVSFYYMSIKRYTGSGFSEILTRKRWNGSAWVDLTVGKRWNGSAWVDLWSNSSGSSGSSGSGSSSGTATSGSGTIGKVTSKAGDPDVNYSASFDWTKTGTSLSVSATFAAWISSASWLGTGKKLTIYARLNGGEWKSVVIKENGDSWKYSPTKHYKTVSLTGTAKAENVIQWYVTRAGSNTSGSAGVLGSKSSPKTKKFS